MRFSQSSEISDTYLYGESYRGLFRPATMSPTVDFGIPVRIDT